MAAALIESAMVRCQWRLALTSRRRVEGRERGRTGDGCSCSPVESRSTVSESACTVTLAAARSRALSNAFALNAIVHPMVGRRCMLRLERATSIVGGLAGRAGRVEVDRQAGRGGSARLRRRGGAADVEGGRWSAVSRRSVCGNAECHSECDRAKDWQSSGNTTGKWLEALDPSSRMA